MHTVLKLTCDMKFMNDLQTGTHMDAHPSSGQTLVFFNEKEVSISYNNII